MTPKEVGPLGNKAGPGVPEALPRTLRLIGDQLGADTLDQMWIFPPLVRGRKEWGLVAVSRLGVGDGGDVAANESQSADGAQAAGSGSREASPVAGSHEPRRLYTAVYSAERKGARLTVEPALSEEGIAPQHRLARVMDGVVRRSGGELGDPREITLGGDPAKFEDLVAEFEIEEALEGTRGHQA